MSNKPAKPQSQNASAADGGDTTAQPGSASASGPATNAAVAPAAPGKDAPKAPAYKPVEIPVDEHHGKGGEYELVDGVRRLVGRTAEEGDDEQPDPNRA